MKPAVNETSPLYDVVVVGAGPAGSAAATLLARCGISVLIVDRSAFPRPKLCGDFISYDAVPLLQFLGVWPSLITAGANPIRRARIFATDVTHHFPLGEESVALGRERLDALLLQNAAEEGAIVQTGYTVVNAKFDGFQHILDVRDGRGERHTIGATVVLGAWGRWSRLDLATARKFTKLKHRWFGIAQYLTARQPEYADCVDLHAFAGGYVGVAQVEGGRANVCALVREDFLPQGRLAVERWLSTISRQTPSLQRDLSTGTPIEETLRVSPPVIFAPRCAIVDGMLMIGDAAGVIPPIAGSGIASALQSAFIGAVAALQIVSDPCQRSAAEHGHERQMAALLSTRLRWARPAGWLLSRPHYAASMMRITHSEHVSRLLMQRTRLDHRAVNRIVKRWENTSSKLARS